MLLGAHISTADGIEKVPRRGRDLFGCDTVQFFAKNQKQWSARPLAPERCEAFRKARTEAGIRAAAVHASYLINLAATDAERRVKSRAAFGDEVERAALLGADSVIFHPGAHLGAGDDAGIVMVAEALREALDGSPGAEVKLLIETTAGQGTNVGFRFEQIAQMIEQAGSHVRIGVCYDTCHTFAAGYDIRTRQAYRDTWQRFDDCIGFGRLQALHLNDSKRETGSRIDRHEELGQGHIGLDAFCYLMEDPRLAEVPGILETPSGEEGYADNLARLRGCVKTAGSKAALHRKRKKTVDNSEK